MSATESDTDSENPREQIHPEHDVLTPENQDDWTEEQIEQYNEITESKTKEAVEEEAGQISEETENALAALADPYDERTTERTLPGHDGVTVEVLNHMNDEVEGKMQTIDDNTGDLDTVRSELIDVILHFIEDDTYGYRSNLPPEEQQKQEDFARCVWTEYARKFGTPRLAKVFYEVAEPALDDAEDHKVVRKFRNR